MSKIPKIPVQIDRRNTSYFSGEILITNCDEEQSYAAQLIQYMSDVFNCPSPIEEFIEM